MEELNFGQAIEALKTGARVQRAGWNGKGMWLILIRPNEQAEDSIMAGHVYTDTYWGVQDDAAELTIAPVIALRTAQDTLQLGWLASQADMLAEDWRVT